MGSSLSDANASSRRLPVAGFIQRSLKEGLPQVALPNFLTLLLIVYHIFLNLSRKRRGIIAHRCSTPRCNARKRGDNTPKKNIASRGVKKTRTLLRRLGTPLMLLRTLAVCPRLSPKRVFPTYPLRLV